MFVTLIYQIIVLNVITLVNYKEEIGTEGFLFTAPLYIAILMNIICIVSHYDGLRIWINYLTVLPVVGAVVYFSIIKLIELK